MLIIGRAVAGLGCSGLMNGCLTLIFGAITPEKRTRKFRSKYLRGGRIFLIRWIQVYTSITMGGMSIMSRRLKIVKIDD